MNPLVDARNLELLYPGSAERPETRIGPVSFAIGEGEALGLIGESGAGKSTVGVEVLGLLRVRRARRTAGEIHYSIKPSEIAYIPQDPAAALDPLFSIGYQMREIGGNAAQIQKALAQVHLLETNMSLKSYPHELSGGMRQRVVVAMALLRQPRLIVADEPTSSLDVTLQREILNLFLEIKKSGISFLLVTHHLPLAALFCDRISIMKSGKIVETGVPAEIIRAPASPYTRELLDSIPPFKAVTVYE